MTEDNNWIPRAAELDPVVMTFVRDNVRVQVPAKNSVNIERVRRHVHDACRALRNINGTLYGTRGKDCEVLLPVNLYLMFLWAVNQYPTSGKPEAPASDEVNYAGVMVRPAGDTPWKSSEQSLT